ncbi:MAG: type VI secretion system protein TssA [Gemmataceae bacterium]
MSTQPLLAFDQLLAPIPGDDPAGEPVTFATRAEMEEARKEVDPADFDADDPLRPTEAKKADWKGIVRLATKTLTGTSKDLLVAARLTEALTRIHGYGGLADGLQLLRRMLDECWDRLHPAIEDGDMEVRAGPFNWLGDDARGARFPYTVRTVPLFKGDAVWYTLRDWKTIAENKPGISRDDFERAMNAAPVELCQQLVDDLNRSVEEMSKLLEVLNKRLGRDAPAMTDLRAAQAEALTLCKQALSRKAPVSPAATAEPAEDGAPSQPASAPSAGPVRPMSNRADIYARLREAADLLERMEPHSPVPYLIRRAVLLGSLPFPQMMKALMREEFKPALDDLNRELGIVEPAAAPPAG